MRNSRSELREKIMVILYQIDIYNERKVPYEVDEVIKENIEKLVQEIKKYYPKQIYIIGYPEIPIQNIHIREGIKKLNTIYNELEGITYISTSEIITSKDFFNPNSIFPSKEAYEKISKEVIKKLAKEKNN